MGDDKYCYYSRIYSKLRQRYIIESYMLERLVAYVSIEDDR